VTFSASEIEQAWGRLADRMSTQAAHDRARATRRGKLATIGVVCVALIVALWLIFGR
jgi:CHASE3 domain sensor protein